MLSTHVVFLCGVGVSSGCDGMKSVWMRLCITLVGHEEGALVPYRRGVASRVREALQLSKRAIRARRQLHRSRAANPERVDTLSVFFENHVRRVLPTFCGQVGL